MAPSAPAPRPRRILLIMLRRIGDVLLTTPAARALRRAFPDAAIDFLAEPPCADLLEGDPDLSRVLRYDGGLRWLLDLRRERYDWVVDYMGTPRSAFLARATGAPLRAGPAHVWHRWAYTRNLVESSTPHYSAREKIRVLRQLGLQPDETDCLPSLRVPPEAVERADEALRHLGALDPGTDPGAGPPGPLVGLVPASRRLTRRWPAARFSELGRGLRERRGARLLVLWGPGERPLAEQVAAGIGAGAFLSPETAGLWDLAALLARCDAVVSNCNGPRHMATALRVPTLTVHGSSDPRLWNPPGMDLFPAIRRDELHCIGCQSNRCRYALECLEGLTADRVLRSAEELLARSAARQPG